MSLNGARSGLTNGEQTSLEQNEYAQAVAENEASISPENSQNNTISLPENNSQLEHIFGNRPGHVPDTAENRRMLENLANDSTKFKGRDKYGNSWNITLNDDGKQPWVRYQNGVINEGGINDKPRPWDDETGLNQNPFKRGVLR